MDQWYLDNLVCPVDKQPLNYENGILLSYGGRQYPVVEGIPVMLVDDVEQTMPLINASLERSKNNSCVIDERANHLYLESLGISEAQKEGVIRLDATGKSQIDPAERVNLIWTVIFIVNIYLPPGNDVRFIA